MDYPKGLDPYIARQHLLHHTFSPLISIQATHNVDQYFQSVLSTQLSTLQILKPYGNNAKYNIPSQQFKIINTQLITKNYASFPIRFEPSLPELLSISHASRSSEDNRGRLTSSSSPVLPSAGLNPSHNTVTTQFGMGTTLTQLFSITSLEMYLRHVAKTLPPGDGGSGDRGSDIYLTFLDKFITSNQITSFETFNHPIGQIFIIDLEKDNLDILRRQIVEFRNVNFPKFFQIDDLLVHVFIIYDETIPDSYKRLEQFQNEIRNKLSLDSTGLSISATTAQSESKITVSLIENSTIEEDLQRFALDDQNDNTSRQLEIPKSIDSTIRNKLYDYINKFLIPHMQAKIRQWDDQVLQPKRSITSRFFSASRKFFTNSSSSDSNLPGTSITPSGTTSHYNYEGNYYYKTSPEQTIRKLADWSLILKDFKYAYSTYDLIKKDYTNDRAWCYVASVQEMCIVSLLLAQTQQNLNPSLKPPVPDKNTLRKIKHDIVEPYIDNLTYTFKSRLNLKTYSFRSLIIVIELLLCMCQVFNISYWFNDLIERYLIKLIAEFQGHLTSSLSSRNSEYSIIKAILYERLGYSFGHCVYLSDENLQQLHQPPSHPKLDETTHDQDDEDEENYINPHKLHPGKYNSTNGLMRYRKSALWYLLALKEWIVSGSNYNQIRHLVENIKLNYDLDGEDQLWYTRPDLLLGLIKTMKNSIDKPL
ncbi:uncharacterized protein J8A68_005816 [[Candida] subhashii]|uniref:Trafficking protein particle complex III-specific subunit 85 n=1 Tax=[Candida] subhashii TaxID=561895 RepID=A0A8J5QE62_9ASCO|nr:uncharacterized protein J8A68_005816 [[Candida] subhashii]KAG7660699.1 hypothetical protein J8A68_005816 [[Candida] subhashii]